MNETELLARLREEVPLEDASAQAERLFLAGLFDPAGSARRARHPMARWWGRPQLTGRLALAGGLSLAVAASAAAVAGLVGGPGGVVTGVPQPGGGRVAPAVREMAYRVAAAARQQPQVSPGQWVYWKEARLEDGAMRHFEVWTTADPRKAAFVANGKVYPVDIVPPGGQITSCTQVGSRSVCKNISHAEALKEAPKQYIGQPQGSVIPPQGGGGTGFTGEMGPIPVAYADLGSLPSSPEALDQYLADLKGPDVGLDPPAIREFDAIENMITSYVMPPQLTAELYRALGDIPGVTVDEHAVDVAGRPGIGFISPAYSDGSTSEIIVNPQTYQLTGDNSMDDGHTVSFGNAILSEALVSGPGVQP
ncbi:MAG TPA: CU044_5270 family protein [Streptosporangiaceae bacterium]|nr:CU044_5270 family protein [Streptosporangiaceae bacterium]